MILAVILALLSLYAAYSLADRLTDPNSKWHVLDHPNDRSLHQNPTPRSGGLGILAALLIAWPLWFWLQTPPEGAWAVAIGLALAAGISWLDDLHTLSSAVRFPVHLAASGLVVFAGGFYFPVLQIPGVGDVALGAFAPIFALLTIGWMLNLYNFMDGMDGFAGGMGAWGFGFLALFGWHQGHLFFAGSALIIAAANLGFLRVNFPPAKIFMGDVGSVPMGFLAGCFMLWGARDGVFPFWIGIVIFSPFILDATITLARRLLDGQKVWQAHRAHFYQQLVRMGWSHKRTVLAEYLLMAGVGGVAFLLHLSDNEGLRAAGWMALCGLYIVLMIAIHVAGRRRGVSWRG
ncbi:MraY family glycosyltransferase [Magnetofaba australis]|uniref:Putative Undecaprenyl-phosphate N-acetylglucosaminyl 1-phosphate transferase n=1 Tax=Magnetofaba australis IT-1 TaxID=1434232 RepID=A0A1Y2K9F2_9PROT|nr:glycosyltransferase family 4 protein [Magnetofaba australis]OSM05306.1 putative Undecaprenyl-phosphate N-acetylglucosaminyl 1-phosphate transferase [Magnetofaba australis IT-1]